MAEIERTYIIPLRREFLKAPRYRRAKKTIAGLRSFLKKHMKSDNVKLGMALNDYIWERGIQNPPHKVKVTVKKDDKGVVRAELFGVKTSEKKTEAKKTQKESKAPQQEVTQPATKQVPAQQAPEKSGAKQSEKQKPDVKPDAKKATKPTSTTSN